MGLRPEKKKKRDREVPHTITGSLYLDLHAFLLMFASYLETRGQPNEDVARMAKEARALTTMLHNSPETE